VNLLQDNTGTINKNTGTLMDNSKEVGLEVNTENKYRLLFHHQNVKENQKTAF
jgi:hypothetical protein